VIALIGLLGILIGEQLAPLARQMVAGERVTLTWVKTECGRHIFGALPRCDESSRRKPPRARTTS